MATSNALNKYLETIGNLDERVDIYKQFISGTVNDMISILSLDVARDEICDNEELSRLVTKNLCDLITQVFYNKLLTNELVGSGTMTFSKCALEIISKFIRNLYNRNQNNFNKFLNLEFEILILIINVDFYCELCDKKNVNFNNLMINFNNEKNYKFHIIMDKIHTNHMDIIKQTLLYNQENEENVRKGFTKFFNKKFTNEISSDDIKKLSSQEIIKLLNLLKNNTFITDSFVLITLKMIYELLQRDDLSNHDYDIMFNSSFKIETLFLPNYDLDGSNKPKILEIFHKLTHNTITNLCTKKSSVFSQRTYINRTINYCDDEIEKFNRSCYGSIIKNYEKMGKKPYFKKLSDLFPFNLCKNFILVMLALKDQPEYIFSDPDMNKKIRNILIFSEKLEFNKLSVDDANLIETLDLWEYVSVEIVKNILNVSGFKSVSLIPENILNDTFDDSYVETLLSGNNSSSFIVELSNFRGAIYYNKCVNCIEKLLEDDDKNFNIAQIIYENKKVINKYFIENILKNNEKCRRNIYIKHIENAKKLETKYYRVTECFNDEITYDVVMDILYPENINESIGICKICDKNIVTTVFSGCGHTMCGECIGRLKSNTCPWCRNDKPKVKLYI